MLKFGTESVSVEFDLQDLSFCIFNYGVKYNSNKNRAPYFTLENGLEILFSSALNIEHKPYNTGVGKGVLSSFSSFFYEGENHDISFQTYIWVEDETGKVHFEFIPLKERKFELAYINWPSPIYMEPHKKGYTVLPIMQGMIIPDNCQEDIKPFLKKRMFSREASMPWWGQISNNIGYLSIIETPWDAEYTYLHKPNESTSVCVIWIGTLGEIRYTRKMQMQFLNNGDYVSLCKMFRAYVAQKGRLISLKEKIQKNPLLARMIGQTVVYTKYVLWHCEPESNYFDKVKPENNHQVISFDETSKQLKALKEIGVDKAYVHIDGWGKMGYDNQHPDVLPPSEEAGGIEGMKRLLSDIRDMSYIPAIHDQYRDYYTRAETYNENQSVLLPNGQLDTDDMWPGGNQTMLCANLAPSYVTRNYDQMEKTGILPDGAYLDVFSVVELDECDHPLHRMTRKECMEKRCECIEIIRSKGLIVSSEEAVDGFVSHLDLVHHTPYAYALMKHHKVKEFGIPVPLFNLVYHDCLLIPWEVGEKVWGLPKKHCGLLHGLLNGGLPSIFSGTSREYVERTHIVNRLHQEVGLSEMISHTFINDYNTKQQTLFATGTTVTVDFEVGEYTICWADRSVSNGKIN